MRHSAGTWSGKTSEVPGFPKVPLGETTSRFMPLKWDAVSRRGPAGNGIPF